MNAPGEMLEFCAMTIDKARVQAEMRELVQVTEQAIMESVRKALASGMALEDLYAVVIGNSTTGQWEIQIVERQHIEHLRARPDYGSLLGKEHIKGMARVLYRTDYCHQTAHVYLGPPLAKGGDA